MGIAYWNKRGLLISLQHAVEELNARPRLADVPQLRADQLKRIVAELKDVSPPYSSFDPALRKQTAQAEKRKSDRREYMRQYMRQRRDKRWPTLLAAFGPNLGLGGGSTDTPHFSLKTC